MDMLYAIGTGLTVALFGLHIIKVDHNQKMLKNLKLLDDLEKKTDDVEMKERISTLKKRIAELDPL